MVLMDVWSWRTKADILTEQGRAAEAAAAREHWQGLMSDSRE